MANRSATKSKNKKSKVRVYSAKNNKKSRTLNSGLLWVFVLLFGVVGAYWLISSRAAGPFEEVGTHPLASQQSTGIGRQLRSLTAWNGKVYAGYGDWDANTGPVGIVPFDVATNKFAATAEFTADTEAIEEWRTFGGRLFVPSTDPRYSADYSVATATSPTSETWSSKTPAGFVHSFDIASLNGSDLYLAGSKTVGSQDKAQVYRSTDGGNTWQLSLDVAPPTGSDVSRMGLITKFGSKIFAQQHDFNSTTWTATYPTANAWLFDGVNWTKTTAMNVYAPKKGSEFAGQVVALGNNVLYAYNGRNTSSLKNGIRDYTISSDGYLYTVGPSSDYETSDVLRTKDLKSWEFVSKAPTAVSITTYGDYIYVGTAGSKLYRASISQQNKDAVPPTVSLVTPTEGTTISAKTTLAANASDLAGVKRIEFYVDENLAGYATSKGDPHDPNSIYKDSYRISLSGLGYTPGAHVIKAVAYDTYGNTSSAAANVTFTSDFAVADTSAPTFTTTYPAPNTVYKGSTKAITLAASATDNLNIARMTILYDGVEVARNENVSINMSVSTRVNLDRGSHSILFTVVDTAGNQNVFSSSVSK